MCRLPLAETSQSLRALQSRARAARLPLPHMRARPFPPCRFSSTHYPSTNPRQSAPKVHPYTPQPERLQGARGPDEWNRLHRDLFDTCADFNPIPLLRMTRHWHRDAHYDDQSGSNPPRKSHDLCPSAGAAVVEDLQVSRGAVRSLRVVAGYRTLRGGGFNSNVAMSAGRLIHACLSFVQTDCSGRGKLGSANAPIATPTRSTIRAGSQYTFDPHRPQKWNLTGKPLADPRSKTRDVPLLTVTRLRS
jgi:hypothetical protein